MIKQIKRISCSDLDKFAVVFDEDEVRNHCIIIGDKLDIPMLIEFKEGDDDANKNS